MDSLDQGAKDIPLSRITHKEGKVRFEVSGVGGVYEGTLATDGTTLAPYMGRGTAGALPRCPSYSGTGGFAANYAVTTVAVAPTCVVNATDHVLGN